MELFLDKSGLALDVERSEYQCKWLCLEYNGIFIGTLLVLDVEKPQCLSCMWCVLVVCNNVQNTRKVLGLL